MTKTIGFRVSESEQQAIEAAISAHQCNDLKSLVFALLAANSKTTVNTETTMLIEFPDRSTKQWFSALVRLNKAEPFQFIKQLIFEVKNNTIIKNIKGL